MHSNKIKPIIKIIIKRIFRIAFYIFVFLISVSIVSEIWFRIEPEKSPYKYFKRKIRARLWSAWSNKKNTDPLLPPFKIFSNKDFENVERLHRIVKETSLIRNAKLKSYDFLRADEIREKTYYTATVNNLGFRDPPRTIQKPENVFRIIALGSYHTFGHAVNDKDTYPRQLERILNSDKDKNIVFEVWNGGRHAASAIVGLAKLQTEILDYKPDLIIWDYGFVDPFILEDNNFPISFFFPDTGVYRPVAFFFQLAKNITAGKSVLFIKFGDYLLRKNYEKNIEAFVQVNKKMIEIIKVKNIPVIVLRQNIASCQPYVYQKFSHLSKQVYFVEGEKIFEKFPPSPEQVKEFQSGQNWLSEYDPALAKVWRCKPPEYFINIYQYNELGHRAIAKYLADEIIYILAKDGLSKNRQYKLQVE